MISSPFPELLVQALFKPGSNINPDHKEKYLYILAYAASVYDQVRKGCAIKEDFEVVAIFSSSSPLLSLVV